MQNLASELGQPFFYKGESMRPRFRPGDVLYVRSPSGPIVPGDVIVFQRSIDVEPVVHRVIRVMDAACITRGDNNRRSDSVPVTRADIIGRVRARKSTSRMVPVRGASLGLLSAQCGWAFGDMVHAFRYLLRYPYRILRGSSFPCSLLTQFLWWSLDTVQFETPKGLILKTTFLGRTVAVYYPGQKRFICRKPFDLFIKPPTDSR